MIGNLHRAAALVDHAHGDRPDRRAAQAADDVRQLRPPRLDVDGHRQERVDQRHGVGAGVLGRLARIEATSVTFGVSFGITGSVRHLPHRADDVERAVQAAAERDAAFLDVRAGDVQLERGTPSASDRIRASSTYSSSVVPQMLTMMVAPSRAQLGQLLGDEAVDADALQPDGVQHAGRRLDDARRRMALARLEEQPLDDDARRATTGRRRRRTRRRSRSSRWPRSAGCASVSEPI